MNHYVTCPFEEFESSGTRCVSGVTEFPPQDSERPVSLLMPGTLRLGCVDERDGTLEGLSHVSFVVGYRLLGLFGAVDVNAPAVLRVPATDGTPLYFTGG